MFIAAASSTDRCLAVELQVGLRLAKAAAAVAVTNNQRDSATVIPAIQIGPERTLAETLQK